MLRVPRISGERRLQPEDLQERRVGYSWKLEYRCGREPPGVPTPSLPGQEPVDHPEQEGEQCGGIVGRSHRMAVREPLLMRRVPYHWVFGKSGARELV